MTRPRAPSLAEQPAPVAGPSDAPELHDLFAPPGPSHTWIEAELRPSERLLWQGKPTRFGFFTATPWIVGLIGAALFVAFMAPRFGAGLAGMAASAGQNPMFLLAMGIVSIILVGLLLRALRDRRQDFLYAVTNRRAFTCYKGKLLREAKPHAMSKLMLIQGPEREMRGIGHVIWKRVVYREHSDTRQGPDMGFWGFAGIAEPQDHFDRLKVWAKLLEGEADVADRTFADGAARTDGQGGTHLVANRRYGFALTVPDGWTGRVARKVRRPLRIFGIETSIRLIQTEGTARLPGPADDWTFLEIEGLTSSKLHIWASDGPMTVDLETAKARYAGGAGSRIIQTDDSLRVGPYAGFSIIREDKDGASRYIQLGADDWHLIIEASVPGRDAGDQSDALDAVIASIRPLNVDDQ